MPFDPKTAQPLENVFDPSTARLFEPEEPQFKPYSPTVSPESIQPVDVQPDATDVEKLLKSENTDEPWNKPTYRESEIRNNPKELGFWNELGRAGTKASIELGTSSVASILNMLGTEEDKVTSTDWYPGITEREAQKKGLQSKENFSTENNLYQVGEDIRAWSDNYLEENPWLREQENQLELGFGTFYKPQVLGRVIGQGLPSLLVGVGSTVGATALTGNPIVGMATGMSVTGILEAGGAYTTAKEYGSLSPEEQRKVALLVGGFSTLVSGVPLGRLAKKMGVEQQLKKEFTSKIIKKNLYGKISAEGLKQGLAEATEEVAQELINIRAEIGYMDEADAPTKEEILKRVGESGYGGFLLGTGTGVATEGPSIKRQLDTEKFNKSKVGKEILKARESEEFDEVTLDVAENFARQNPKAFEKKSLLNFIEETRTITREQKRAEGWTEEQIDEFFVGEGLDAETEGAGVLGSTLEENGKVLINLYKGARPDTVIEEFYGNAYRNLSEEQKSVFSQFYEESGSNLTEQEFFEKEGVKHYINEKLYENTTVQKVYRKLKQFFNEKILGNTTLDPKIRKMWEDAGYGKVGEGTTSKDESFQLAESFKEELFETSKKVFGTTTNSKEAGYILPDGSMLDFSGKSEGGTPGTRAYDHRNITRLIDEEDGGSEKWNDIGMDEFINAGAIRFMPEAGAFDMTTKPDYDQLVKMRELVDSVDGEVIIEASTPGVTISKSQGIGLYREYDKGTSWETIKRDVLQFYNTGRTPSILQQFHESFQLKPMKVVDIAKKLSAKKQTVKGMDRAKLATQKGYKEILKVLADPEFKINESLEWYNEAVADAKSIGAIEVPEIKSNKNGEALWDIFLGITSLGTKIPQNYESGLSATSDYLTKGKFNYFVKENGDTFLQYENEKGELKKVRRPIIGNMFKKFDFLVDKFGIDGAIDWIYSPHNGKEILKLNAEFTGNPKSKISDILTTKDYYGTKIFGPKIGRYISNLHGIHEEAVYDIWYTRTWNRWMGTPLHPSGKLKGQPKEAPQWGTESQAMDRAMENIRKKLSKKTGREWDVGEIQAVLWYYEKELYIKYGQKDDGLNYKDVAKLRAQRKGYYEQFTTSEDTGITEDSQRVGSSVKGEPTQDIESSEGRVNKTRKRDRKADTQEVTPSDESFQITAFHGSPYNFDKFDSSQIGSGEGNQAFGHGLYFSSKEDIAKYYIPFKDTPDDAVPEKTGSLYNVTLHKGKDPSEYDYMSWVEPVFVKQLSKLQKQWKKEFPDKPDFFDDSKRRAIDKVYNKGGFWLYRTLAEKKHLGSDKAVSDFMLRAGIDGIRYPAQGGTGGRFGDSENFVVFDDSAVTIDKQESFQLDALTDMTIPQRFERALIDKLNRLKMVQESIPDLQEDEDAIQIAETLHGTVSSQLETFRAKIYDSDESILTRAKNDGFSLDDIGEYLYARHAKERNIAMQEKNEKLTTGSGMTDAEANTILKKHKGTGIHKYALELYREVTNKALKVRLDAGLIDKKTYKNLKSNFKNYVPLKGLLEEDGYVHTSGKGFNTTSTGIMSAFGRESKAQNPLIQAIIDYESAVYTAENNKVGNAFLKMVQNNESTMWKVTKRKFKPTYNEEGEVSYSPTNLKKDEFQTYKDGQQYVIKIRDKDLLRAMNNLNNATSNLALKALSSFNTYFRAINTTLNPEFMITNFERDLQTALLNMTSEGKKNIKTNVVKDIGKAMGGIKSLLRGDGSHEWAKLYEEFKANGGKAGWLDFKTIEEKMDDIAKDIKKSQDGNSTVKKVGKFIEDYNEMIENAVRLSTYKNLVDSGLSKKESAHYAKDLTVNFNRKGESSYWVNALWTFSNAGMQGSNRIWRALKSKNGKKVAMGITTFGFIMSALNRHMDEDEWDQFDEYNKDNYFMVLLPNKQALSIKLPYGWNWFYSVGGAMEQAMFGDTDFGDLIKRVAVNGANAFSPITGGSIAQVMSPTISDPLIQLAENKNFFGGPIMKDKKYYGNTIKDHKRGLKSVSPTLERGTEGLYDYTGLDVSPETIEHIIESYTGGTGKFVANNITTMAEIGRGSWPDISKVPVFRQIFRNKSNWRSYNKAKEMLDVAEDKVLDRKLFRKYLNEARSAQSIDSKTHRKLMNQFNNAQRKAKRNRR